MGLTGLVYSEKFCEHIPYPGNPEIPQRVSESFEYFGESGLLDELTLVEPEFADTVLLEAVHPPQHIDYVRSLSINGYPEGSVFNTDVFVGPKTFDIATLSASSVFLGAKKVWRGELNNVFCLTRPPGHHCGINLPSGFCYFNNSAVAIKNLMKEGDIERIAVFDWDAHCGNGTMNIFYDDPNVLTISAHQNPKNFFPGTGFMEQIGRGEGKGFCINIPLEAGSGDGDYKFILDDFVLDKIADFDPAMIFIAAGQDSHISDCISGLNLTDAGFAHMCGRLKHLAEDICGGKLVLTFEGGYNLHTLPKTNEAIIRALAGLEDIPEIYDTPKSETTSTIESIKNILAQCHLEESETFIDEEDDIVDWPF